MRIKVPLFHFEIEKRNNRKNYYLSIYYNATYVLWFSECTQQISHQYFNSSGEFSLDHRASSPFIRAANSHTHTHMKTLDRRSLQNKNNTHTNIISNRSPPYFSYFPLSLHICVYARVQSRTHANICVFSARICISLHKIHTHTHRARRVPSQRLYKYVQRSQISSLSADFCILLDCRHRRVSLCLQHFHKYHRVVLLIINTSTAPPPPHTKHLIIIRITNSTSQRAERCCRRVVFFLCAPP